MIQRKYGIFWFAGDLVDGIVLHLGVTEMYAVHHWIWEKLILSMPRWVISGDPQGKDG